MDSQTPAIIDDFVNVGDAGEDSDSVAPPENESAIGDSNNTYVRKILPPEFSKRTVKLTCESTAEGDLCDVYLVGTTHVSSESCQEVQAVICFLKPQVVFLELCPSRRGIFAPQDIKVPTFGEMVKAWKKKQNLFGILISWFLAKITIRRTWAKMPLWHKTQLFYAFMYLAVFFPSREDLNKSLKEMDDVDKTPETQKLRKQFPALVEGLVHERDLYMSPCY